VCVSIIIISISNSLQSNSGVGFDFTVPYLYNGLQFGGKPPYVDCANNFTTTGDDCADTKICVLDGTTHQIDISSKNSNFSIVSTPSSGELYENFLNDICNVIAGEQTDIAESILRGLDYTGDYALGAGIHSKEPLCIVTRTEDPQWSDFTNWVMTALLAAEDGQVTQRSAAKMGRTKVFGPTLQNMFVNVIKDVGNYGEMYRRNLEDILPRATPDRINSGETGLVYSFPFGNLESEGSGASQGGTLDLILVRGHLNCGIARRSGFAEFNQTSQSWTGTYLLLGPLSSLAFFFLGVGVGLPHVHFWTAVSYVIHPSTHSLVLSLSRPDGNCKTTTQKTRRSTPQQQQQQSIGLDVDFCLAIAAAIGLPGKVVFSDLTEAERFVKLQNGDVDVLSRITVATLEGDVLEPSTGVGFSYSQPTFYDGLAFGGEAVYVSYKRITGSIPRGHVWSGVVIMTSLFFGLVVVCIFLWLMYFYYATFSLYSLCRFTQCADKVDVLSTQCQGLQICVTRNTTYEARLVNKLFPERYCVPQDTNELAMQGLVNGLCNVLAGSLVDVSRSSVLGAGFPGSFGSGAKRYTKDPFVLVTREDDTQFSTFVFWVVTIIFYAEEQGITMATASDLPTTALFGSVFSTMFQDAVAAVGNYAEIYARNLEKDVPRSGSNLLNTFLQGPQHYPYPGAL
jgi:ABC-type amino acid transport substrate-binding protein